MNAPTPAAVPLPFDPSFEQVPDDEAQTSQELAEAMQSILDKTYADNGHAIRSVHAKAHGLLRGQIDILDNLPPALAQGVFAKPGSLPLFMRFSTNPGDLLDDKVSTPEAWRSSWLASAVSACRAVPARSPKTSSCKTPRLSPPPPRKIF